MPYALRATLLIAFLMTSFCSIGKGYGQTDNSAVGLSRTKPQRGPSVAIDGGFMVPYEVKIPGTQVKYYMLPIPGGKFTMGSPKVELGRLDSEGPQFEVTVEPFWMSKYELTWAEYKSYMELDEDFRSLQKKRLRLLSRENDVDAVSSPSALYDPSYTFDVGQGNDQPAATMTHFSSLQYTKWLSLLSERFYRLPTEAEWEYACRAGTKTAFHFGDDASELKKYAWFEGNSEVERHAVGQLLPNPWGLYDMHGNVAEWVMDGYDKSGYQHVRPGESVSQEKAYFKSDKKHFRVVRGGSFEMQVAQCRSSSRLGSTKDWADEDPNIPRSPWWYTTSPASGVGFRIVRPLKAPPTREKQNEFWNVDIESLGNAKRREKYQGRGMRGPVDPDLPTDILKLKKDGSKK